MPVRICVKAESSIRSTSSSRVTAPIRPLPILHRWPPELSGTKRIPETTHALRRTDHTVSAARASSLRLVLIHGSRVDSAGGRPSSDATSSACTCAVRHAPECQRARFECRRREGSFRSSPFGRARSRMRARPSDRRAQRVWNLAARTRPFRGVLECELQVRELVEREAEGNESRARLSAHQFLPLTRSWSIHLSGLHVRSACSTSTPSRDKRCRMARVAASQRRIVSTSATSTIGEADFQSSAVVTSSSSTPSKSVSAWSERSTESPFGPPLDAEHVAHRVADDLTEDVGVDLFLPRDNDLIVIIRPLLAQSIGELRVREHWRARIGEDRLDSDGRPIVGIVGQEDSIQKLSRAQRAQRAVH